MRNWITLGVLGLVLVVAVGILIACLPRVRDTAARQECVSNLQLLGIGLHSVHDVDGSFPSGTVSNPGLPPERRLSWLVGEWAYVGDGQVNLLIDRLGAWDDEGNREPRWRHSDGDNGSKEEPLGEMKSFLCPSNPSRSAAGSAAMTHYVGVAGVGRGVASRGLGCPGAGVFGYDRRTRLRDIKDGSGHTLLVVETARDNGPWTAGGPATVRELDPAGGPFLGVQGQFSGLHRSDSGWPPWPPYVTHAVFADASVRGLTNSIRPEVFEALATIADGDKADE